MEYERRTRDAREWRTLMAVVVSVTLSSPVFAGNAADACARVAELASVRQLDTLYVSSETVEVPTAMADDPDQDWYRLDNYIDDAPRLVSYNGADYLLATADGAPRYLSFIDAQRIRRLACEFELGDVGSIRAMTAYESLVRSADGRSPWGWALTRSNMDKAELMLANGHTLSETIDDMPLLSWAIWQDRDAAIDWLLERGADVNARTERGYDSPLEQAIRVENPALATRLIRLGADLSGQTPYLWMLAKQKPQESRELLITAAHKLGSVPEEWVAHAVQNDPPLIDELLRERLQVQRIARNWHAGREIAVPFEMAGAARRSGASDITGKLESLFRKALPPKNAFAMMTYGSYDDGLVVQRWQQSTASDEELLKFATSVCIYFVEADCGPESVARAAVQWSEQLGHECPKKVADVVPLPVCNVLAHYVHLANRDILESVIIYPMTPESHVKGTAYTKPAELQERYLKKYGRR